ncbi:MAG: hypothetical protein NTW42_02550 [Deltaproteobacteria bacterium]|nr:hypothetical protein [Deltaproteobacteria bacterium]
MKKTENGHCGKFPRFTPNQEMYVFHNEVGRVLDISMDGVTFTYIADNRPTKEFPPEGMLFTVGGTYIHEIPFERISDHVHGNFFSSGYFIRERRICFGELSTDLVKQLECFILENAHIPQLSYDARYLAYKSVYAATESANFDNTVQERVLENNTDIPLARCSEIPQG